MKSLLPFICIYSYMQTLAIPLPVNPAYQALESNIHRLCGLDWNHVESVLIPLDQRTISNVVVVLALTFPTD